MSLLQKCYIKANFLSCIFFLLIGPFTTLIFQEVILISCLSSIGKVKRDQYVTVANWGDLGGEGVRLEALMIPPLGVLWRGRGGSGRGVGGIEGSGEGSGISRGAIRCNCLRMCSRSNYYASPSVGIARTSCLLIPIRHMKLVFLFLALPVERLRLIRVASCTRS